MKIVSIILLTVVLLNPVYAMGISDPEVGLKVGQWVKYRPYLHVGDSNNDLDKLLQPMVTSFKDKFANDYGLNIDDVEWMKSTVSNISGTVVTFDRSVKSENGIEKKLAPVKVDLAEFHPATSIAMPINLEFGSEYNDNVLGDIVFSKIDDDPYGFNIKNNLFTSNHIFSQKIRQNVVENTIEYDILTKFRFEQKTGILLESYKDVTITNKNTYDTTWVALEVSAIDYSEELKHDQKQKPLNDKSEILERLSEYFIETPDSEFLIKNEFVSITDPKVTSYDIILAKDGSEIGSLKLYGDNMISSASVSTIYNVEKRTILVADRIVYRILQQLTGHTVDYPDLLTIMSENKNSGQYSITKNYDDAIVSIGWIETDSVFGIGILSANVDYDVQENAKNPSVEKIEPVSESKEQEAKIDSDSEKSGCLIATATFGTELAPQVQLLREIRDNVLFRTGSGTAFMAGFNEFYYTFSPVVADFERENAVFRELVRGTITPMLSTLSILNYVDINSESEMLGYGIGVILLNIGMYFVAPVFIIAKLRKKFGKTWII